MQPPGVGHGTTGLGHLGIAPPVLSESADTGAIIAAEDILPNPRACILETQHDGWLDHSSVHAHALPVQRSDLDRSQAQRADQQHQNQQQTQRQAGGSGTQTASGGGKCHDADAAIASHEPVRTAMQPALGSAAARQHNATLTPPVSISAAGLAGAAMQPGASPAAVPEAPATPTCVAQGEKVYFFKSRACLIAGSVHNLDACTSFGISLHVPASADPNTHQNRTSVAVAAIVSSAASSYHRDCQRGDRPERLRWRRNARRDRGAAAAAAATAAPAADKAGGGP